jgi:hypothetical protein
MSSSETSISYQRFCRQALVLSRLRDGNPLTNSAHSQRSLIQTMHAPREREAYFLGRNANFCGQRLPIG